MRHAFAWMLFASTVAWGAAILAAPRVLLAAAASESRAGHAVQEPGANAARLVYRLGHFLCHQRPERSFHAGSIPYPLCARCTGLHLAPPFGLLALLLWHGSRHSRVDPPRPMTPATAAGSRTLRRWRIALIVAALPTIVSVVLEWIGGPSGMVSRCLAALPLGATVATLAGATLLGLDQPLDQPAGDQPARAAD